MDEKLKILKMVEEKKISAEEAEELLSALSTPKKGKRTFTFKFGEKGTIIKEFNNIKSVDINIQGCNVELRKGERVRIEYRGSINTNSKNGMLEIVGKWADVVLFLPGDIDVNIQGRYLNLEGELSANLEMDCKASNIELRILKPIKKFSKDFFKKADHFIGQVSYQAAPEAGQTGDFCGVKAR